ncbi:MAG: DUF4406 domain-containing protein [Lachnospiraceae bacterium]
MRIYISGKITGLKPSEYRGKFKAAVKRLRKLGHDVVDPSRIDVYHLSYGQYMAIDGILIKFCDAIYMLDNWEDSNGARFEKEYAESLGLLVMYEEEERNEEIKGENRAE